MYGAIEKDTRFKYLYLRWYMHMKGLHHSTRNSTFLSSIKECWVSWSHEMFPSSTFYCLGKWHYHMYLPIYIKLFTDLNNIAMRHFCLLPAIPDDSILLIWMWNVARMIYLSRITPGQDSLFPVVPSFLSWLLRGGKSGRTNVISKSHLIK